MFLARLIDLYSLILLAAVVLSWTGTPPTHPAVQFTRMLTEPLLAPLRRILPPIGGLDFTPMVALVLLRLLRSALVF